MNKFESIEENLKFLILEVESQVRLTFRLLNDADLDLLAKIASKDDYVDNLKKIIENDCFSKIHGSRIAGDDDINFIRSSHVICLNLERIADFCVNIARQTEYLLEFTILHQSNYHEMFGLIQNSLSKVLASLQKRNLDGALEICRSEYQLDELYKENFDTIMARMRTGHYVEDLITTLFIFRYLERIGDSLLNIGEALIFAAIGEPIKIDQFESLERMLSKSGMQTKLSDGDFKSIWGSRSGCRIGRVAIRNEQEAPAQAIFKEGNKSKIRREKENIERWRHIVPGLGPKVLGYRENGDKASLLVEFIPGRTLDSVILSSDSPTVRLVADLLKETLTEIWQRTKTVRSTPSDYMDQLKSRMETIRRVHPEFLRPAKCIDALRVYSSEELMQRCEEIEKDNPAPFSTLIHGDFNTNNILYDTVDQTISFVDFYRTKEADYIQDASVFLVSNFRMPVFESGLRQRLNWIIDQFYEFFAAFARDHGDAAFELRLALAMARSFYTSTRFELNHVFAREMFTRSHYLMEKILATRDTRASFHFPRHVLYY
jgi:phosphate uptake regulator/aminoglycoside phosphotransferase